MTIKRSVLGLFFLLFGASYGTAVNAASGDRTYVGIQYAQIDEEEFDLEPTAVVLRLGKMTDQGYGYEFRLGTGLSGDDRTEFVPFFGDVTVDLEVDSLIGVYLLAEADVGPASVYGIIGFTRVDFTLDVEIGTLSDDDSDDESDLSFGFGATFGQSDKARFNLEYMQYLDKNDVDASAISFGILF